MTAQADAEVLLVEDNPKEIDLTMYTLQRENLVTHVQILHDGEEALDYLFCRGAFARRSFDQPPRLVLLDLNLPKVSGLEVLQRIKGDDRTKTIPVVILTASQKEQDLVRGYDYGANSYIRKPVDFGQFSSMLKTLGVYWLQVNRAPLRNHSALAPRAKS